MTLAPALRAIAPLAALTLLTAWQASTPVDAQSFPQWGNLKAGRHAVGFRVIHTIDRARSFAAATGDGASTAQPPRPIRISLWYPAAPTRDARPLFYRDYIFQRLTRLGEKTLTPAEESNAITAFAAFIRPMKSLVNGTLVPLFPDGLPDDRVERMAATPTAAFKDATPATGRFPVVLYLGDNDEQSILFEYLASHGYVVAVVPNVGTNAAYPGSSDPDRVRREAAKSADLEFVLPFVKQLDNVDASKVAAVGIGVGFAPAVRLQSVSSLLSLLVAYGAPNAPSADDIARLRIPILHLLADDQPAAALEARDRTIESLIHAERHLVRFSGVGHPDLSSYRRAGHPETSGRDKPYEAAATYIHKFLDAHLRGDAEARTFLRSPAGAIGFDPSLVQTTVIAAQPRVR